MNILACTSSDSSFNSLRPEHEIYISLAKSGHNITIITHKNEHNKKNQPKLYSLNPQDNKRKIY